jgi:hypothetical protein
VIGRGNEQPAREYEEKNSFCGGTGYVEYIEAVY